MRVGTNTSCSLPEGWQSVEEYDPELVVFGEQHGTEQSPRFIGEVACALASRGERVLLAIEHDARSNDALQAAWSASAEDFEQELLQTGWIGRQDGVASEAMFAMLADLHDLKLQGFPISVFAFNSFADQQQSERFAHLPGQNPQEAAEAENLILATAEGGFDRVLVLVGSLHARTDTVVVRDNIIEPMTKHLKQTRRVLSLEMLYSDGTSYNCLLPPDFEMRAGVPVRQEDLDCRNHPSRGNADFDRAPFIELELTSDAPETAGYDGFFWVGPISGSPPMSVDLGDQEQGVQ